MAVSIPPRLQPLVSELLSFALIDRHGRSHPLPYSSALPGYPRFLGCADLAGVRMTLPGGVWARSIQLTFCAGGRSDPYNGWLRAPLLPPVGAFRVDGVAAADTAEHRWQERVASDTPGPDLVVCELRVPDRLVSEVTVRFPPGPYGLVEMAVSEVPYEGEEWQPDLGRDLPEYPPARPDLPRHGDALAEELLLRGELSLEGVWRLALPYRGGALLAAPETPAASVSWDGGLVVPAPEADFDRLWLKVGLAQLTRPESFSDPGLLDGWLPVSLVRSRYGDLALEQTAFVGLDAHLHVRYQVHNGSAEARTLLPQLAAVRTRYQPAENAPDLRAPVHEPVAIEVTGETLRLGTRTARLSSGPGGAPLRIAPGAAADLELTLPLGDGTEGAQAFDPALLEVRRHFAGFLDSGAGLELPDPRLAQLWRALLVQNRLFARAGKMRYGAFPGLYDGAIFGIEEGWNIVALSMYGHGRLAQELLEKTFFDSEFLRKEGQHHQYRNGLCITYALDVYRLTGDLPALLRLLPTILDSALWISAALRSTQVNDEAGARPVHWGLMPRHTYGGDLTEPAYSLYGSSACWRGLRDAAIACRIAGHELAERLEQEAAVARRNMLLCAERIFRHQARPPFLPFRTDETRDEPGAGDYYQLFASLILETALFGWSSKLSRAITSYLPETGRTVLGVARFDRWFGRVGVDAEYSRGLQLCHLNRRDFDRFHLGLLGQIGLSCDPFTFVSPETAMLRFSREEHQDRMRALAHNPRRPDPDPCSAGTAVMLQYLRWLLCYEERDEDDLPTGTLYLGAAAPARFFAPGQAFGVRDLPTALGTVSFRCEGAADKVRYEVKSERPITVECFFASERGERRSQRRRIDADADGTAVVEFSRG